VNHSDVQDHMADYLEGHLPLERRALFDAHLDDCGACSDEIREMQQTITFLRSLPEPEVPAGFSDSVMRRVRETGDRAPWLDTLRETIRFLASPRVLVPASVAMIALGIIGGTGQVQEALLLEAPGAPLSSEGRVAEETVLAGVPLAGNALKTDSAGGARPTSGLQIRFQPGPVRVPTQQIIQLAPIPLNQFAERPQGFAGGAVQNDVFYGPTRFQNRAGVVRVAAQSQARTSEKQPSADEWLVRLRRNPGDFAAVLSNSTLAEQELWIANLARHATERGELDEIVAALRASPSQRANLLAEDFVAASRKHATSSSR